MKAVILAGGFGTRLSTIANDIPKPMIFIAGKPLLEHQIIFLKENGIKDIIITIHHMGNVIKSYFGDGSRWQVDITYSEEETPLGTAGAIKNAEKYIDDTFVALNGNAYSHINLKDFLEFHKIKRNIATIALSESKETKKYGNVILEENKVVEFAEKESISENALINSGFYIFEPIIFDYIEKHRNVSLEREIFTRLAKERMLGGYKYEGYFMDITRPETYHQFKKDILKSLCLRENDCIREAMKRIIKNNIDLVLVIDKDEKLLGVLNDKIIKKFLLEGGSIDKNVLEAMVKEPSKIAKITDDKEKIYNLLLDSRHLPVLDEEGRIADVEFRVDKIKLENFPVIRGRAPFRISFAGGGTDLPHFFEKYGGVVINCTIDKYCYGTLMKRADSKVVIGSDLGEELVLNLKNKPEYDGRFDLIKAIINIMKPTSGFELYLHNDIPPGRGLGSSATLAILVTKLISTMQESFYDDYKIAEIAYKAETEELKIKGGWQDQYAAVTGGFNFMEFNGNKTLIYPLRLKEEIINEFNHHLLLCYVGETHFSGDQQAVLENAITEEDVVRSLDELKKIAIDIKNSLLTNNIEEIGRLLHKSWENKKRVSKSITNPKIDRLYEIAIMNGAYGGKLLGSGGGGYLLIFHTPKKRNQIVKALQNEGGEIMNFNFEFNGAKIWTSHGKGVCN